MGDLDAEHLAAGVGVRVEMDKPDGAVRGAGAYVGLRNRVGPAGGDRDRAGRDALQSLRDYPPHRLVIEMERVSAHSLDVPTGGRKRLDARQPVQQCAKEPCQCCPEPRAATAQAAVYPTATTSPAAAASRKK